MAAGKYRKWLEPDNLILLEAYARNGLTDEQIAHNMGIALSTLYEWKKKYPEISESLKKGKEVVDTQVENALLKRALGYDYEEVSEEYEKGFLVKRKVTIKHVVPDTTAQIFWLKNRKAEDWRDKRTVEDTIEYASSGFMDALKEQAGETFKEASGIIEEGS
ncbi:MAG: transposase [Muribaculum sp.]|nr:transposase [Muribaculum sp.]